MTYGPWKWPRSPYEKSVWKILNGWAVVRGGIVISEHKTENEAIRAAVRN